MHNFAVGWRTFPWSRKCLLVILKQIEIINGPVKTKSCVSWKMFEMESNPLNAKPTKWPNILKQFVGNLATNFLNVFDHFVGLVFKGLIFQNWSKVLCLGVSEPRKRLAAQSTTYALRNRSGKRHLSKKMKKKKYLRKRNLNL